MIVERGGGREHVVAANRWQEVLFHCDPVDRIRLAASLLVSRCVVRVRGNSGGYELRRFRQTVMRRVLFSSVGRGLTIGS